MDVLKNKMKPMPDSPTSGGAKSNYEEASSLMANEQYPKDINIHRKIFDRELEIIKPRLIIAFGKKVNDLLTFALAGNGIPITMVWHYSYLRRFPHKVNTFKGQIQSALEHLRK